LLEKKKIKSPAKKSGEARKAKGQKEIAKNLAMLLKINLIYNKKYGS